MSPVRSHLFERSLSIIIVLSFCLLHVVAAETISLELAKPIERQD